jgi:hypothetical protein
MVRTNPPVTTLGTPHPPPDAHSLVLEEMALINVRLDAHATETATLRHRDALRDAPTVQSEHHV